ncbi:MAG: GntR family transcriptional regulator [Muribaculaceae bacterium]|nr:GntR family transcriptional regulator [Muribaculaceae bacterium]
MIEFSDNKPIYRQIVDHACNLILNGSWEPGARVPSVRELAAELGVNTRCLL